MALSIYDTHITQTTTGATIGGATVSVTIPGTGAPAQLYEDRDGLSGADNPFTADPNGRAQFYLAPGRYNVSATGGGVTIFYPDVLIGLEFVDGVQSVATIADLRALEPIIDGQQISLLGHTVAGIGGGDFYHDDSNADADDDGCVVVTAGGKRWLRKINGQSISVEFYGILPAQVGAITAEVQAAIDWAHNSPTVKEVTIPAGDWFSDTVYLRRGITVRGAGKGVTNLYQAVVPTVEGMIRGDLLHEAHNSKVFDISFFGNGMVPANTALMKAVLFEEVKDFVCGDCHAEDFSSYGFWAHTADDTDEADLCERGLFHDLTATNVEHALETKRAKDVTWLRCHVHGKPQYSMSAFHPWERSENIKYIDCKATGDFGTAAINTLGAAGVGLEANNKNLYFDVEVDLNKTEDITTPNACGRVYRADDVTIVGKLSGFSGILWGGSSGDIKLDAELNVVSGGFRSPNSEIVNGTVSGNLKVNLARTRGAGLVASQAFDVEQNGAKIINMGSLEINYSADGTGQPFRIIGIDEGKIDHVEINSTTLAMYIYSSSLTGSTINITSPEGSSAAMYAEDSYVNYKLDVSGFAPVSLNDTELLLNDGSKIAGRICLNLADASVVRGSAEIISDATSTTTSAYAINMSATSKLQLDNSAVSFINAASLPGSNDLIRCPVGAVVMLSGSEIVSDQPSSNIDIYTPNTMITNCSFDGVEIRIQAGADKSMITNNIVDVATTDASTGSLVVELVR